jgi:hypothetical protein
MRRHNHPLLGLSVLAGDLHGLVHVFRILGWTMALIPYLTPRPK